MIIEILAGLSVLHLECCHYTYYCDLVIIILNDLRMLLIIDGQLNFLSQGCRC